MTTEALSSPAMRDRIERLRSAVEARPIDGPDDDPRALPSDEPGYRG